MAAKTQRLHLLTFCFAHTVFCFFVASLVDTLGWLVFCFFFFFFNYSCFLANLYIAIILVDKFFTVRFF